jgi:hypothetical protein
VFTLSDSLSLLNEHLWLGAVAAFLFVAGLGTSVSVVRNNVGWLMALPLWLFRRVLRVIGPHFPPVRTFLVIFCFNSVAIFLYMASGVLIVLPAAVAFLTGINIGVAVLKAGEMAPEMAESPVSEPAEEKQQGLWVGLCSGAVLLLELPSFWISVAMGIGLGRALSEKAFTITQMGDLLLPRAVAYVQIIVPALFVSALAETAAIRGHLRALPTAPEEPVPAGSGDPPEEETPEGGPPEDESDDAEEVEEAEDQTQEADAVEEEDTGQEGDAEQQEEEETGEEEKEEGEKEEDEAEEREP